MVFVQNLPFISIILSLFTGPLSSVLGGKKGKISKCSHDYRGRIGAFCSARICDRNG